MAFRHNEGRDAGSRDSAAHGVSFLVGVDAVMPSAPGLGGCKHASAAAHVSVCGLTRAVGTDVNIGVS